MSLTFTQAAAIADLDAAIAAALDVSDGGDGNYDRTLVARCDGTLAAVQIREQAWTGFATARAPLHTWANDHPPR